jgi:hypothetical protein
MRSATLLTVAGLIIGLTAAPDHAEAASPGTIAHKSMAHPSALVIQVDDDDDNGRAKVRRRAKPTRYLGHGVRRYYPRRYVGAHSQYRWTYRKYVPRKHWRGGDDDD